MITRVRKRDGRVVPFNLEKIALGIYRAAQSVGGSDYGTAYNLAEETAQRLERQLDYGQQPDVELIQDTVEKVLIDNGHASTAKSYILCRADRSRIREMDSSLMKIYEGLTFQSAAESDLKRENANIDADTAMGTMLKYGSEGAKKFNQLFVLKPEHSKAHIDGDIHIHDLDFLTLTTTCTQIDLHKLFTGGFSTGHGYLREPNDIASYSALACIAIQANQNDQHGGQSIPCFDYYLSDGVRKTYRKRYRSNLIKAAQLLCSDEIAKKAEQAITALYDAEIYPCLDGSNGYAEKEQEALSGFVSEEEIARLQSFAVSESEKETDRATYQAMEALVHNLNTMNSRAGSQVPFSSINYGTDTSPEGRMVSRNVMLATEAGLGAGETPIFPIHIFKVKEGVNFNPGDPNYDLFKLAIRVSAKRLFPNFSFLDAPFNLQYYKPGHPDTECAYMGCRTRVIANHYDPEHEIVTGRGNLSFTSINLPRLAILAKGDIDAFFASLDEKMYLVVDQLLDRFRIQARKKVRNYPMLMGQGVWLGSEKLGPDDEVGEVLKQGTLTMGFIGLAECLKALTSFHHGESEESQKLGLRIISHMRERTDRATEETGLNFSLIATPAEGLSGTFVRKDKVRFGILPGITDREYYTNSFHIPVYYDISAFDKLRLEAPYHALTNGGHISYIELDGDPTQNLDAFERVVRYMKEVGIGYGSINHPVDRDPVCGFTGIIANECPHCRRKETEGEKGFERIRRITGYLVGTTDRFNDAKRAEEKDRVKHGLVPGKMEL